MRTLRPLLLLPIVALLLLPGCRKDKLFTDDAGARLDFSVDTILFDTVFTQPVMGPEIPSVIKRFVARNPQNRAVRVNIALEGGTQSPYRINVDGVAGTSFQDVEILGGDSVFVFVEATLDQSNTSNPLVIEDRILFNTNGNSQHVQLMAWGQDAYYHWYGPDSIQIQGLPRYGYLAGGYDQNGAQICGTVTWASDKPHVVYGYGVVDSCNVLIIEPGTRVHVHSGGGIWVYRYGRIEANGTFDQPIVFQGDRLEPFYQELAGQWDRIWVNEGPSGAENLLENVVIKNAFIGIQAEMLPLVPGIISDNTLVLNNVNIRNCSAAGILSRNYRIRSTNMLLGECGQYAMALTGGGQYSFNHTTIANYWSGQIRQTPSLIVTDRYQDYTGAFSPPQQITSSSFLNGIIFGSNSKEFQLALEEPEMQQITFDRYLIRTDEATTDPEIFPFQDRIWRNQEPGFSNATDRNFGLMPGAFARNKATIVAGDIVSITDIEGKSRNCDGDPDLGAYEYCP